MCRLILTVLIAACSGASAQTGAPTPSPAQGTEGDPGAGVERIGRGVSPPVLLYAPDPEFSEQARKAKVGGIVLVKLIVDERGTPLNVRVVRGIGYGLDEKAVAAVSAYRFRPATRDGQAVKVEMNVQVNFQIFTKPAV